MTRVYTRLGDDGSTGLLFGGRTSKSDPVIAALGSVDEAVAALGLARANCQGEPELGHLLLRLQRELFVAAADLACNPRQRRRLRPRVYRMIPEMVAELEALIDGIITDHPLRPVFVVPGNNLSSAFLDLARTSVRRAEREAVELSISGRPVAADVIAYLNRLSDLLYVVARRAAKDGEEPASHE